MKRSLFFPRCTLHLAASLFLLASTGCLSIPSVARSVPSAAMQVSGPPVWDSVPSTDFESSQNVADGNDATAEKQIAETADQSASGSRLKSQKAERRNRPADRIASRGKPPRLVDQPGQFAWLTGAKSTGKRDIQSIVIGRGGYRTLLIGSMTGNDKVAVELTERLAKHVHENQIVLGGIHLNVIRNLNPDGEAAGKSLTADGVYLNRQFLTTADLKNDPTAFPAEIQFLMAEMKKHQPQRIIHVRTIGRKQGLVACSSGASHVASDLSSWLGFQLLQLPGSSVEGTLERYLSESEQCDIVTFAMPKDVTSNDAWDLYSDALLNLLMVEDFATRKLARQQKSSQAADSRNRNE